MSEEEIDNLVDELHDNPTELREFINRHLENAANIDEQIIEGMLDDFLSSKVELREFVTESIGN